MKKITLLMMLNYCLLNFNTAFSQLTKEKLIGSWKLVSVSQIPKEQTKILSETSSSLSLEEMSNLLLMQYLEKNVNNKSWPSIWKFRDDLWFEGYNMFNTGCKRKEELTWYLLEDSITLGGINSDNKMTSLWFHVVSGNEEYLSLNLICKNLVQHIYLTKDYDATIENLYAEIPDQSNGKDIDAIDLQGTWRNQTGTKQITFAKTIYIDKEKEFIVYADPSNIIGFDKDYIYSLKQYLKPKSVIIFYANSKAQSGAGVLGSGSPITLFTFEKILTLSYHDPCSKGYPPPEECFEKISEYNQN